MTEEHAKLKQRLLARTRWNGECLESTFVAKAQSGYPLVKLNGSTTGAHRASWLVFYGEIPKGMWVLHKCDNPLCINPNHLFLGTPKDNTNDMIRKSRHNYRGMLKHSDEIVEKAIEMRKSGMTLKKISETIGVGIGSIESFFKRPANKEKVKEFFGVPKYPDEVRAKAFELRANGVRCKEIQRILGIPKRSLSRILN